MLWAKRFKDNQIGMQKRIEALEDECKGYRQEKEARQGMNAKLLPLSGLLGGSILDHRLPESDAAVQSVAPHSGMDPPQIPDERQAIRMSQGSRNLTEYLRVGQERYAELEKHLVETFIEGMASRHQRAALESALAKSERSWKSLEVEVERMVADAERRRKNRRNLVI